MKRSTTLGTIGSLAVGFVLFSTPLTSCGCLEPWHSFLAAAGVADWQDRDNLTESVVEEAARTRYVGRPITEMAALLQDKTIPTACRHQSSNIFDCDFWLMQGLARQSGFQIRAQAAPDGIITGVSVSRAHALLGYRL
jgi:hypothetical protein